MFEKPDFSKYTFSELEDVLKNIDHELYEDRYLEVLSILEDEETVRRLKEHERQENLSKKEAMNVLAYLVPVFNGIAILAFGVSMARYGGFIEIESTVVRIILGSVMIIGGIFACFTLYRRKL